jgi:OTU-like cysteine protease
MVANPTTLVLLLLFNWCCAKSSDALSSPPVRTSDRPSSFLPSDYSVKDSPIKFCVRQVPGDGGCLFHSLAASILYRKDKTHPDYFTSRLRDISSKLRQLSVKVLRTAKDECFFLEGEESMAASQLLEMAAMNYNMTSDEYLSQMIQPSTWGGGPEIVALANHFKRPIHVYELESQGMLWMKRFQLKMCARFGSPAFDRKHPLTILCADGRFPNIRPGQQREPGDHFLALFRTDEVPFHKDSLNQKTKWLRSGRSDAAVAVDEHIPIGDDSSGSGSSSSSSSNSASTSSMPKVDGDLRKPAVGGSHDSHNLSPGNSNTNINSNGNGNSHQYGVSAEYDGDDLSDLEGF